jgi:peptide chain release factor subunit 1
VRELIEKAQKEGILQEYRVMEEKQLIKKFMAEVHSGRGLGIYGVHDVVKALESGIADLVIVTDDVTYSKLEIKCKACKNTQTIIADRPQVMATKQEWLSKQCPSCHVTDLEVIDKDIVEYLNELAIKTGCRLEVISGKTEEGSQLASLGKIGAVLRYKPT